MDNKRKNLIMIGVAVLALGVAGVLIVRQYTTPAPAKPDEKASAVTSKLVEDMKKSEAEAHKKNPPPPDPKLEEVVAGSGHRPSKGN